MRAIMLGASTAALPCTKSQPREPPERVARARRLLGEPRRRSHRRRDDEGMVEHEFPIVLGRDYAGVVEQVGSDVTRYAEGDEVYGFLPAANPTVHDGTWAELIVVPEDNFVARKPADVDLAAAGAARWPLSLP